MAKHNSLIDINSILNEYTSDIQEGITNAAIEVANNGKNELKVTSPRRTGKYASGWRIDKRQSKGFVHATIYNTNPGLTVLLEKTHAKRGGGTVTPRSAGHIAKVEQKCIQEYKKEVEQVIKNGG